MSDFVTLANKTYTYNSSTGKTTVQFDICFAAASMGGSKISGAVIDLDYQYSLVTLSQITVPTFTYTNDFGDQTVKVWSDPPIANLSGSSSTGKITLVADQLLLNLNPITGTDGKVLTVKLIVTGQVDASSFALSLQTDANSGDNYITTADSVKHDLDGGAIVIPPASLADVVVDLHVNSDSGTLHDDNITNVQTPTVTVDLTNKTLAAGQALQIIDTTNANTVVGTYTITAQDATSGLTTKDITLSTSLSDGSHALKAQLSSGSTAGTLSTVATTVTIDTTAPTSLASVVVDLKSTSDSGSSNTDDITSAITPTVTVTLTGKALVTGDIVQIIDTSNGNAVVGTHTVTSQEATSGITTQDITLSTLAAGVHALKAQLTDLAGNTGTVSTTATTVTVDTATATPALALATDNGSSNSDGITNVGTINVGGLETGATWEYRTSDSASWTAGTGTSFTLSEGTYAANNVQVRQTDAAGNVSSDGAIASAVTFDATAPTVSTVTDTTTPTVTKDPITFTVTFTEAIIGTVTTSSFTATHGTVTNVTHTSGNTYTVEVTPTTGVGTGNVALSLVGTGLTDVAGNAVVNADLSTLDSQGIDTQAPSAPTVAEHGSTDLSDNLMNSTEAVSTTFRVTLPTSGSNAVNGDSVELLLGSLSFSTAKTVVLDATAIGNGYVDFTVAQADLGVDGAKALTAKITDVAGNVGAASSALNFTLETTTPTFDKATVSGTSLTLYYTDSSNLDATHIPAITAFTVSDNTVTNVAVDATAKTVTLTLGTAVPSGDSVTVTYTDPTVGNDTNAIQDAAGNDAVLLSNIQVFTIPSVNGIDIIADTGTSDSDFITNTAQQTITATLSNSLSSGESVRGSLDNGSTWTDITSKVSNTTISWDGATLAGISSIKLEVRDAAGNAGTAASQAYTLDTTAPTVNSIVVADAALKIGETSLVTITFSEAVTGFDNSALTIQNGTLSMVASTDGGVTWTATLTPTTNFEDATNVITLAKSGITDTAGNAGSGTTDSNNYAIDTKAPTVSSIVVADNALKAGETPLVTITFSEAVTGFDNNDLTIANGTLSNVSSTDGCITWTATLTPTTNLESTTNVITLAKSGVTDAAGNAGSGTTDSNNYVIDTLAPNAPTAIAEQSLTKLNGTDHYLNQSEAATATTFHVTLPVSGSAAVANDSVELLLGGASFSTAKKVTLTTTEISQGYVDFTVVKADLGVDGAKALTAKITDVAGNIGTESPALNFRLDTVAPANSINGVAVTDSDNDGNGNIVNGTLSAALVTGETLWGKVNSGVFAQIPTNEITDKAIAWNIAALNATPTIIEFEVRDAAGNITTSTSSISGTTTTTTNTITTTGGVSAPLVTDTTGSSLLSAVVPVGVEVLVKEVTDTATTQTLQHQLTTAVDAIDPTHITDAGKAAAQAGISEYIAQESGSVVVRNIEFPTTTATAGELTEDKLVISGNNNLKEALVIDTTNLPDDAVLTLQDVEFAIIIGNKVKVRGGAGDNIVYADGSAQNIVLGTGNDELHGGAGNDYIGSLDGNDTLYGDAGDDTLSGGTGNDSLYGGTGDDILELDQIIANRTASRAGDDTIDGGAGYDTVHFSGNLADYTIHATGSNASTSIFTITHKAGGPDGSDTVTTVESFAFLDQTITDEKAFEIANPYAGSHEGLGGEASLAGVLAFSLISWMVL